MPHSTHEPEKMGCATVSPDSPVEAGSLPELTLTYTAGYFGIDGAGSRKIVYRFVPDMRCLQFDDPLADTSPVVQKVLTGSTRLEGDVILE